MNIFEIYNLNFDQLKFNLKAKKLYKDTLNLFTNIHADGFFKFRSYKKI